MLCKSVHLPVQLDIASHWDDCDRIGLRCLTPQVFKVWKIVKQRFFERFYPNILALPNIGVLLRTFPDSGWPSKRHSDCFRMALLDNRRMLNW